MSPDHLNRAEQACAQLAASGQPITFTAVAARTGIGRASLYRNNAVTPPGPPPSPHSPQTSQRCAPRSKPSPPASATTKNSSAKSNAPPHEHPARTEPNY
jgi:hypothetical protein